MHRFFIAKAFQEKMTISGMDAHHIQDVLRLKIGDKVQIVADDGVVALGEITAWEKGKVFLQCVKIAAGSHEPTVKISLAQGLAKGEKMDFVIQKAVELGISTVYPVSMEHSVVQLKGPQAEKKLQRWQKIAESAAKQCQRDLIPNVAPVQNLAKVLQEDTSELKLLAYEGETQQSLKTVLEAHPEAKSMLVIIGPEGGISEKELAAAEAAGALTVSLGHRILRTETAGMVVLTAILYATGNLEL
jgi:16S rRNA (uracil1498-N3)-methyltransferase